MYCQQLLAQCSEAERQWVMSGMDFCIEARNPSPSHLKKETDVSLVVLKYLIIPSGRI